MSGISDRFFDYEGVAVRESAGVIAFLADRPPSDWETLAGHAEVRRFGPGQTVICAGDTDRALYLLTAGVVAVVLPGQEVAFKEIDAPSVLGEVAFLDGGPRSVTLVAQGECELLRLSMEAFEVLSAHEPELGRAILLDLGKILAVRLRIATDLMAERG